MARGAAREQAEVGRRLLREVEGIFGAVATLFLLASFLSYDAGREGANLCGPVGYAAAHVLVPALGFSAYLIPFYLGVLAWQLFREDGPAVPVGRAAGCVILVLTMATLLALMQGAGSPGAGGWLGGFIGAELKAFLGAFGAFIVAVALLVLSLLLSTDSSLPAVGRNATRGVAGVARRSARLVGAGVAGCRGWWMRRRENKAATTVPEIVANEEARPEARQVPSVLTPPPADLPAIVTIEEPARPGERPRRRRSKSEDQPELPFKSRGAYSLPPLSLLDPANGPRVSVDEDGLIASSRILEHKLRDFGVEGRVVAVQPGPVITTFELEPGPGVKVNRIVALADDLSMALRALSVRILAPVPGKPVVGIEVSNSRREKVFVREVLESNEFAATKSLLALGLGKDTTGRPVVTDLARMPHLLIAGATGAGKSVAINGMILSILFRGTPRDVRFIMIDPKMLELSIYEDIPHLLVPVVTDPRRAAAALTNVTREMQYRYRLLHAKGARGVETYNRIVAREQAESAENVIELSEPIADVEPEDRRIPAQADDAPLVHQHLPRIVIIIDEFADLMMSCGRDIETAVTRLAQKARAAGIHLLLATQRPSVDVITGLIKANFPARLSFQVTTRPDSRTILDCIGAERLLGDGDMLFLPPGTARVRRLHGGFVSDDEVRRVVDFVKQQGKPEYQMDILEEEEQEDVAAEEEPYDEMYDDAVRLVTESGQASISWVQRRLRVGYNRAARIVERMEQEGVVSASVGGRPREVLAPRIDALDG